MEYSKLISVTGLPGLFELVGSKTDGAIVKSLEDQNTRFVSSRVHNFSHLESIEVYTTRDNVNLVDVFTAMGAVKKNCRLIKMQQPLKHILKKYTLRWTFRVYIAAI